MNELITRARKKYLAEHPIQVKHLPTIDSSTGKSAEPFEFPDLGETQVTACKLGMEYLAICHDEEAVEEWIHACIAVAKSPEWAGILFANVFRSVNVVISSIIENAGLGEQMQKLALDAWTRDFGGASS